MKKRFLEFMQKFQTYMQGRYGSDALSKFILILAFILMVISAFFRYLYPLVLALLIYNIFRTFSKNISARQKELFTYIRIRDKITKRFKLYKNIIKNRKTTKYCKCPNCKLYITLPKNKGKLKVCCPGCKTEFIKKT